jgi:hypothetical protein
LSAKVTNEDGSSADLAEHLSSEHRKGTRGFTDEYLACLHDRLHQSKRDPQPAHEHPVISIPAQGGPVGAEVVIA